MIIDDLLNRLDVKDINLTVGDRLLFEGYFKRVKIKKGDFLVKEGDVEHNIYFINEGVLRCWINDKHNREKTFWFCMPHTFSLSNLSFTLQRPCDFNVQAATDCDMYVITQHDVRELYEISPHIHRVMNIFMGELLNFMLQRKVDLLKLTSKEYYDALVERYQDCLKGISKEDLASYLCISEEEVSKLHN